MIKAKLNDEALSARLAALPPDQLLRFTLLGGAFRGALVSGTTMTASMRANHRLGVLETLALGQAYLAASLSSVTLKDGGKLVLRLDCSGALKGFSVEAAADGSVRGSLFADALVLDKELDSFDLAPFIGKGTLSLTRITGNGELFTGFIPTAHSRIAEDVTEYFLRSEQTRTALSVGVRFDPAGRVAGAGGLFLQAMPGADETDAEDLQLRMAELPSVADHCMKGGTCGEFLGDWFAAFEPDVVGSGPVSFSCGCSRERFAGYLSALPARELEDFVREGEEPAEIVCRNCSSAYYFFKAEFASPAAARGT